MHKIILLIITLVFNSDWLFSQVAINPNGSPPDASAGLDVNYSNKGFLPPRMTNAELYNISQPADGLIVYCIDCGIDGTGAMAIYVAGEWRSIFVNNCLNPLPAPAQATNEPSLTGVVWNWTAVSNAVGYRWNTEDNYSTAMDLGNVTTKPETGLNCLTVYTRYVWAYNPCGNSPACYLSQSTTGGPLSYPGSTHSGCMCVTAGGSVETVYEGSSSYTLCKFSGTNLSPPSGWTQAGYWQQYDANTVADNCGRYAGTLPTTWSNASGTAHGNGQIFAVDSYCDGDFNNYWHIWDSGISLFMCDYVISAENPSFFSNAASGTVTRINIGCK